ncbi:MAG TPA: hypothetical protein VN515_03450 [Terriglobales bacterium]|nr:hypothetical protein [Terriglobales bacterium]
MTTKFFRHLALAVLGLAAAACASSIPVTFTSNSGSLGGPAQGVYYYPYTLDVNGGNVTVACDDYFNEVHLGESWNATENTFANLSGALFYDGGLGVAKYREAAWLFTQFQNPSPLVNNVNAAINFAMWDLFSNGAPGINTSHPGSDTSSSYWLGLARAQNLSGFDFSQFVFYTPTSGWPAQDGQPQEYVGEVPEPAPFVLLFSGLAAVVWLDRRRRLSSRCA